MFSFRTTPLEDQLDRALTDGNVGCFCTQNCWDTGRERYMTDIFRERGNLRAVFSPENSELSPEISHICACTEQIRDLSAIVVEIQDIGTRYFGYTRDVFRLMKQLTQMEEPPALYIVDHINPAGRVVEGTMPSSGMETDTPKTAHRHGLTLGELANLYYAEIGARFPLHIISAQATDSNRQLMPWTISPAPDIPGFFTCEMYSGGGLWLNTSITPGIGTARPYEYFGAPFIKADAGNMPPAPPQVMLRPCSFTPAFGKYAGEKCLGYQIMLEPGAEYHSLMHTLQLMRYFKDRYSAFELEPDFKLRLSDDILLSYIEGRTSWEEARDHIKVEEQKWTRKAKKFCLYEDLPYRIK